MPFKRILDQLVDGVDGALAAVFIHDDGETVETVGTLSDYDLKVIGAYQGIFLTRVKALCKALDHGEPQRLKIEWNGSKILNCPIDEEYSVVLVVTPESNEGLAWRALLRGRDRIRQEM
ncbi:MAG: roadblock/LC7 domain-containing protein [Thermoanaerobaculia bacterium]